MIGIIVWIIQYALENATANNTYVATTNTPLVAATVALAPQPQNDLRHQTCHKTYPFIRVSGRPWV